MWALGNYSRFIRPGAVRLSVSAFDQTDALIPDGDTDQQGLMCSAYKNVDGTYVMVVINYANEEKEFSIHKGKESVLLFSKDLVASSTPDNIRLRNFEKISLKPGETKTVTLKLKGSDLAFVGYDGKWRLEKGDFKIKCGDQWMDIVCDQTKVWNTPNKNTLHK